MSYEKIAKTLSALETVQSYFPTADFENLVSQCLSDLRNLPIEKTSIEKIVNEQLMGFSVTCFEVKTPYEKTVWKASLYDEDTDEMRIESTDSVIEIIEDLSIFWDDQFEEPLIDCIYEVADESTNIPNGGWEDLLNFFESHESNKVILSDPEYFVNQYKTLKLLCNPEYITLQPAK